MQARVLREMTCELGEGPLWDGEHLWFFDILGRMLYRLSSDARTLESWEGERMATAAARTTGNGILVATETDLMLFDPDAQSSTSICPLEADNPDTRSNDGRADRHGGFWVGTMGKGHEPEAGAIYRYYQGELRCLRRGVTIPNAICFSPDGREAYFADSALGEIYHWMLGPDGWPVGAPSLHYRVEEEGAAPDGAVIDEQGSMWVAIWGGSRVQRIDHNGIAREAVQLPVSRVSCPALTGDGRLFVTTAREGMTEDELAAEPLAGSLFVADLPVDGLEEPRVTLPREALLHAVRD